MTETFIMPNKIFADAKGPHEHVPKFKTLTGFQVFYSTSDQHHAVCATLTESWSNTIICKCFMKTIHNPKHHRKSTRAGNPKKICCKGHHNNRSGKPDE